MHTLLRRAAFALLAVMAIAHPATAQIQSGFDVPSGQTWLGRTPAGDERLALTLPDGTGRSVTLNQVRGLQAMPSAFPFDFATYPVNVYRTGKGAYSTDTNFRSWITFTPTVTYWVKPGGSDSANCTSEATACASIWKTFVLGNALGAAGTTPYRVNIAAGDYGRARGWADNDNLSGNGTNYMRPRQPVIVQGYGGPVYVGNFIDNALTWAADGTYGAQGVQCATVSSLGALTVTLIADRANRDVYGDYTEYSNVASTALAAATPGTWTASGTTLCVHRLDNLPPTLANLRVFLNVGRAGAVDAVSAYISGISFEGGSGDATTGTFMAINGGPAGQRVIVEDSSFRYGRSVNGANPVNGFTIDNIDGIAVCNRCSSSKNQQDGFNFHANTAGRTLYWIVANSVCWDTGRAVASDNCLTAHDNSIGFDIGGVYRDTRGRTFGTAAPSPATLGTPKTVLFGTVADGDRGDTVLGGTVTSTAFATGGTGAVTWCYECRAARSIASFLADPDAFFYVRNVEDGGGARTGPVSNF